MATELSDYGDPYVELRDGNLYMRGTWVQLESVLRLWLEGRRPEEIQQEYEHIPLAAVYGAIALYLTHRQVVETFFAGNNA